MGYLMGCFYRLIYAVLSIIFFLPLLVVSGIVTLIIILFLQILSIFDNFYISTVDDVFITISSALFGLLPNFIFSTVEFFAEKGNSAPIPWRSKNG